jgi:hypothetical protein
LPSSCIVINGIQNGRSRHRAAYTCPLQCLFESTKVTQAVCLLLLLHCPFLFPTPIFSLSHTSSYRCVDLSSAQQSVAILSVLSINKSCGDGGTRNSRQCTGPQPLKRSLIKDVKEWGFIHSEGRGGRRGMERKGEQAQAQAQEHYLQSKLSRSG